MYNNATMIETMEKNATTKVKCNTLFEISSCPTIKVSDIKARKFYIVDRSQIKHIININTIQLTPTIEDLCGGKAWDKGEVIEVFRKD